MRLSHQYKYVFLSIPRTGSTSIGKLLDPYSDIQGVHFFRATPEFPFYDHITAVELKQIFEKRSWDWERYRRFCVVRNPFDRVVSLYHFKLRMISRDVKYKGWIYNLLRRTKYKLFPVKSFKDYVMRIKLHQRLPASLETFICDAEGRSLVPDVLRFETLTQELLDYLAELGITIDAVDIPHLNASPQRTQYRDYYDEETKERVAKLYRYEIERFGYEF